MIQTPTMQLPKPEAGDPMEPFFLGTQPDGGYWTTMTRLSEHDHTGGLNGKTLTAATIPDGSITPSKLAPSVYAPLTFVDGSKPFTGTQEFQADAVIRDELFFGQQGSAAAPDASLRREAANALRTNSALGLGMAPSAALSVLAPTGTPLEVKTGTAPGTTRLQVAPAGNTTITGTFVQVGQGVSTAGGQVRLMDDGGTVRWMAGIDGAAGGREYVVQDWQGGGKRLRLSAVSPYVIAGGHTFPDGNNVYALGDPANKWTVLYAQSGTINTSAADAKQAITPLDPAAALAAVLATDPVRFTYTAPVPTEADYALPDDPEEAERVLYDRLVNGPLLAAARTQSGFVLDDPTGAYHTDPLFATGTGQSNPANSVGNVIGAIHELHRRLTAGGL